MTAPRIAFVSQPEHCGRPLEKPEAGAPLRQVAGVLRRVLHGLMPFLPPPARAAERRRTADVRSAAAGIAARPRTNVRDTAGPGAAGRFERDVTIRFAHCDPAGIVFYPQYFEIMNGLMEDWFTDGLGVDFADLVTNRRIGIPTVDIRCTFSKPSRLGDRVTFGVTVTRIGERSIGIEVRAVAQGEVRLRATQTLVLLSLDTMRSIPIPDDIRARLGGFSASITNVCSRSNS